MFNLLPEDKWNEYSLLDSGEGRKLERFQHYIIDRPESRASWNKSLSCTVWQSADAVFLEEPKSKGKWYYKQENKLKPWVVTYQSVTFRGDLTPYGHVGYFPDKQLHWKLISSYLASVNNAKVLNLFAYTGVATLMAAKAGAHVTHVDSSRKALAWAKENQILSGLEAKPIRWIYDDVKKFVIREERRGKKYDFIMLDPPRHGRGSNKETWDIFLDLQALLQTCYEILQKKNSLLLVNTYSLGLRQNDLYRLSKAIFKDNNISITSGQLKVQEDTPRKKIVPQSEFCLVKFV